MAILRAIGSAFGKLGIVVTILIAFMVGLAGAVYLSLRSPEVKVPEVVNKSYYDGDSTLSGVGLNIRERAKRFKAGVKPGTILDQSPRAGEVVKVGQTVAVVVSREPREGEKSIGEEDTEEKKETVEKPSAENKSESDSSRNDNRERRKSTNKNTNNANANQNANNTNNRNANNRNTNERGANNRNANNRNLNANRNANANRPANANSTRNRNANTNSNSTRNANRPPPR